MNFSRLSRFILTAALAFLTTIAALAFLTILPSSSQAELPPNPTKISMKTPKESTLFDKEKTLQQDISKEDFSVLLNQAAIDLSLRDTLTKYGVPSEESILISFSLEDQEPLSHELPLGDINLGDKHIEKSFRDAIFDDFIAPANASFGLFDNFRKVYQMPDPLPEEVTKFKIAFKNQGSEIAFFGGCSLCPPYPEPCYD